MSSIEIALAITQIIGVAISIFVLLEMGAQRRSTYRPRLTFDNKVMWLKTTKDGLPFVTDKEEKEDYRYAMHDFHLRLHNIGIGIAHTINISWEYNISSWIKQFLPEYDSFIKRKSSKSTQFFYKPSIKEVNRDFGFLMTEAQQYSQSISNITADNFVDIRLPDTILNGICFTMHSSIRLNKRSPFIDHDFPTISVKFSYKDIGNRSYSNRLKLIFNSRAYSSKHPYLIFGFTEMKLLAY